MYVLLFSHWGMNENTYPRDEFRHPHIPNNNSHSPHPTHLHHSQPLLARSTIPFLLPPNHNPSLRSRSRSLRHRLRRAHNPFREILLGVVQARPVRWRRIGGDMPIVLDVSPFLLLLSPFFAPCIRSTYIYAFISFFPSFFLVVFAYTLFCLSSYAS